MPNSCWSTRRNPPAAGTIPAPPGSCPSLFQLQRERCVMPKVLVLYYSAYGHIEKMAEAVAEGAREAGAHGRHQARAGTRAGRRREGVLLQDRPEGAGRDHRRPRQLRCHHRRHRHALRPHGVADGELPRSGRRALGERRAARQGRRRVHLDAPPSMAARRRRCSRSSPICCISAWSSSASTTAMPAR